MFVTNRNGYKNHACFKIYLAVVIGCLTWTNGIFGSKEYNVGTVRLEYNTSKISTIVPYCNKSMPICRDPTCTRNIARCSYEKTSDVAAILSLFKNISEHIQSIYFLIDNGTCADFPPNVFETFTVVPILGFYSKAHGSCDNITTFVPYIPIWTLDIMLGISNLFDSLLAQFTSVSTLMIRGNSIEYVNTKAFLNLPQITELDLSINLIEEVPSFQFENSTILPNLHSLSLHNNQLTLLPAFCFVGLHELVDLDLSDNIIVTLHSKAFERLLKLKSLNLRGNQISDCPDFVFTPLVSLTVLNLSKMGFIVSGKNNFKRSIDRIGAPYYVINTKSFINLTSLRELNLDDNSLQDIPPCEYAGIPVYPNLKLLSMNRDDNQLAIPRLHFDKCLRNLRQFSMINSYIYVIGNNSLEKVTNLSEMDLSGTNIYSIESHALSSNSLTNLTLVEAIVLSCIDSEVFERAPLINYINIANINIQCITDNGTDTPQMRIETSAWIGFSFRNLTKLNALNLSGHGQKIITFSEETFRYSTSIRYLYLRNIDIRYVKYTSLPSNLWTDLIELDLSDNPFVCDCELVWFRRWLERINTTNTTVLRLTDPHAYTCSFPIEDYGKSILGHDGQLTVLNELRCFTNEHKDDWILLTESIFLIIVGILSLFISLLFRYRWHVRYWHFVMKSKRRQEYDILDEQQYEYDAFVMYSHQDSAWVIHELRSYLETKENFRLCIHDRDFLVGQDIVENIVESIEASRKCLLIVSNAFAESNWCQFELTMAQTSSIRADRKKVILILLEEITEINMTPRLRLQMAEQTYIEWTNNRVSQQLFWKQLARAIKKPTSSIINLQPSG